AICASTLTGSSYFQAWSAIGTNLSNTAESSQAVKTVQLIKRSSRGYFIRHSYQFGWGPGFDWSLFFPFLLLPRKRLLERCGFASAAPGSDLACLGWLSFRFGCSVGCFAPPFFFPSGRRLFLPDLRFFLLRSSNRVRLSCPTTFS